MPNKMLIDATHPEETRVVVVRGNRVEEFDFETAQRKQLRGNIYLAKVTRVEPSLQAAFIEYGGNRHGFLAFSEIHPDYYQIPVADRQALIEADERAHREAEEETDNRSNRKRSRHRNSRRRSGGERVRSEVVDAAAIDPSQAEQPYDPAFAPQPHDGEQVTIGEAHDHGEHDHAGHDHAGHEHAGHVHDDHAPDHVEGNAAPADDHAVAAAAEGVFPEPRLEQTAPTDSGAEAVAAEVQAPVALDTQSEAPLVVGHDYQPAAEDHAHNEPLHDQHAAENAAHADDVPHDDHAEHAAAADADEHEDDEDDEEEAEE
ncbi:MAG: ribonuclease E/G, partial [Tardiphaga sp.]